MMNTAKWNEAKTASVPSAVNLKPTVEVNVYAWTTIIKQAKLVAFYAITVIQELVYLVTMFKPSKKRLTISKVMINDDTPPKLAEILRDTWPQLFLLNKPATNHTTDITTSSPSETEDNNSSQTTKP